MSNFSRMTKHPKTGEMDLAEWLDDHFGHHRYGVRFPDGQVFRETEIEGESVPYEVPDFSRGILAENMPTENKPTQS